MGTTKNATRNACIAAVVCLLAVGAPPIAAATIWDVSGAEDSGPCYAVNTSPPNVYVSRDPINDCI